MSDVEKKTTTSNNGAIRARAFVVVAVLVGVLAAWFGQTLIHKNDDARDVIVTVFSIMAGFLIAIMTLLGDQSVMPGSWRFARAQRALIVNKLIRQKWLFHVYLVTLSLIFLHTLVNPIYPAAGVWLERLYFGFATTSFLLSFSLPSTLMNVQAERIEAVINSRKASASKLDQN